WKLSFARRTRSRTSNNPPDRTFSGRGGGRKQAMSTNLAPESQRAETPSPWQPPRESLPSHVRADEPTLARWIGFAGLWLLTLGIVIRILEAKGRSSALTEFAWPLLAV